MFKNMINFIKQVRINSKVKKINNRKWKSSFLKSIIIKKTYSPPLKEKIIKWCSLSALLIGFTGMNWKSRLRNKSVVNNAYKKIIEPSFVFLPPALAFSLVMAFIPILLLIYIIISSNSALSAHSNQALVSIFGKYANIFFDTGNTWKIFSSSSTGVVSILLIILISSWTAASGFSKFIFSCSLIYKHDRYGGFWMNRLRGISIVIIVALYLSLMLTIFIGITIGLDKSAWLSGVPWLRILIDKVILFITTTFTIYLGIGALFKFAPRFKLTWKHIHPGAIIATIPTAIFLVLFTNITSYAFNYSTIGGSLSYYMTMAMSLLVFSYFIYIGVIANAAFYNTHVAETTKRKMTVSRK